MRQKRCRVWIEFTDFRPDVPPTMVLIDTADRGVSVTIQGKLWPLGQKLTDAILHTVRDMAQHNYLPHTPEPEPDRLQKDEKP